MQKPDWTLTRTSNPSGLAVSLDEAKNHLRVSGSDQDTEITLLVQASTEKLERDINRCILQATWQQSMACFPEEGYPIELMVKPATVVSSITYVDPDGVTQTLDSADYSFSAGRQVVFNESDNLWPEVKVATRSDKVFVGFTCGVSDSGCVNPLIKQAILLETGRAYFDPAQENQSNSDNGKTYEMIVRKLLSDKYV